MAENVKFDKSIQSVEEYQTRHRRDLASCLKALRDNARTVLTKSDINMVLKENSTVRGSTELEKQDELIGDITLNMGGLTWAPHNESLGMLLPSLNSAASCVITFSAIYSRIALLNSGFSWLFDVYTSQFSNGMLSMVPKRWDLFFYSSHDLWSIDRDNFAPFFSMYNIKASISESLSYSYTSDALQTHSITYYSEDAVLNTNYIF